MSKHLPDRTPSGPAYEGRLLPRPDEEVVDQGLAFDVATLVSRRRMLAMLGVGAGMVTLAACGASAGSGSDSTGSGAATAGSLTEIPDETNGPYPADGSNGVDVLERSGIVRADIRSSFGDSTTTAEGIPLVVELTVLDLARDNAPFAGVAVYIWQCDRAGLYSMYSDEIRNENYLRGVQIADAAGTVRFTSIFPACYSGRWPHIHLEVYPDEASITDHDTCIATSQLALPKDVCDTVYASAGYEQSVSNLSRLTLESDNVFGDDGGVHQLATVTGSLDGYVAQLTVPIDTTTEPTAGGAPGGGRGGGNAAGNGGEPPSGGPGG